MTKIDMVFHKLSQLYDFYRNVKKYKINNKDSNRVAGNFSPPASATPCMRNALCGSPMQDACGGRGRKTPGYPIM